MTGTDRDEPVDALIRRMDEEALAGLTARLDVEEKLRRLQEPEPTVFGRPERDR